MKYYILKAIVERLQSYKSITYISRIDDNLIQIDFDKESFFFDLTRSKSLIYKREGHLSNKSYLAPFDIVLKNRFTKSQILSISLLNDDKIIEIKTSNQSSYKEQMTTLQLEFTGKNTNAIILEDDLILEALRHIDISTSFREIRPNKRLLPIIKQDFEFKIEPIEDIDRLLEQTYLNEIEGKLKSLKSQKLSTIEKKVQKLKDIYNSLDSEEELLNRADNTKLEANIVLANLHKIKFYAKSVTLEDFEGNSRQITLPESAKSVADFAKILFDLSKRYKQKAKSIHIERDNLESKINFFERLKTAIESSKTLDEVEFYYPKQKKIKKEKKFREFESFFVNGFKILIGRNQNENAKLLKLAKSNDIWMHIKDIPSSHIIIQSDKKNLPNDILEIGAKLCVDFSVTGSGNYLVDYTKRKDVRIQSGANVLYYNYKTISIKK
jgi:predicted ribosome quality control (RQC) complex YloA/Tae2 family protein